MDILNDQPSDSQLKKKSPVLNIVLGTLGIAAFAFVGYIVGATSTGGCTKSVLGVQTDSISSRLALLLNLEKPTQNIQNFQLAPTSQPLPTEVPTPTDVSDTPSMIWGGLNRNPGPTSTPTPNNVITTPPEQKNNTNNSEPTPTPKYKTNWDRNTPEPTPNNVIIEASAGAAKPGDEQTKSKISIVPIEVQNFIAASGLQMDELQIIRNEGEVGIHVSGGVHEKLFGLIPVSYPISIQIDENRGTIEAASIPWWRTLLGNPFAGNITKIRCGDGICSPTENYYSCASDCAPVCGNGICEYGEGVDTCPSDCEMVPNALPTIGQ